MSGQRPSLKTIGLLAIATLEIFPSLKKDVSMAALVLEIEAYEAAQRVKMLKKL